MPVAHDVIFICPKCRSNNFGSYELPDKTLQRTCHGCYSVGWNQKDDWQYFFLTGSFLNQEDYQKYRFTGTEGFAND